MKSVINKRVYDTKTANLVAEYHNGLSNRDFRHIREDLYVTKKGQYFLHASGGPLTIYSESNGNTTWGIEKIILLSKEEAYEWLEEKEYFQLIEELFNDEIQEG